MRSRSFAPASVSEGGMDDYYDTIKVSLFVVCYGRFVVWHEATHTHTPLLCIMSYVVLLFMYAMRK